MFKSVTFPLFLPFISQDKIIIRELTALILLNVPWCRIKCRRLTVLRGKCVILPKSTLMATTFKPYIV